VRQPRVCGAVGLRRAQRRLCHVHPNHLPPVKGSPKQAVYQVCAAADVQPANGACFGVAEGGWDGSGAGRRARAWRCRPPQRPPARP
jgi:hypothetical protein